MVESGAMFRNGSGSGSGHQQELANNINKMRFQRNQSYLPPEGDYTGTIVETRIHRDSKNGQTRECLRHTLVCDHDDIITEYRARADYWSSQINDFARDAQAILGDQCKELIDSEHNIIESKLDLFVGKRVEFTVVHEYRPGHKDAFRKVINLKPRKLVEPKPRFPITPLKDRLAA